MTAGGTCGRAGRLVVGVDGSAASRAAVGFALRDGLRRDAEVQVVRAFDVPLDWTVVQEVLPGTSWPSVDEMRAALMIETAHTVEHVARAVAADLGRRPCVTVAAVGARPAVALVRAAAAADLLVVGSRGRGTVAGTLLGSVSLHCVRHAPCPVTVVPAGIDVTPDTVSGAVRA